MGNKKKFNHCVPAKSINSQLCLKLSNFRGWVEAFFGGKKIKYFITTFFNKVRGQAELIENMILSVEPRKKNKTRKANFLGVCVPSRIRGRRLLTGESIKPQAFLTYEYIIYAVNPLGDIHHENNRTQSCNLIY
jgi:hypothetical protein